MAPGTELAVAFALPSGVLRMKPRSMCALWLALALPALGQTEPQLEPLVPQSQPKKAPQKKPPPAPEGQLELPPLAPLTPSGQAGGTAMGILVLGDLPDAAAARVSDSLRAVLERAPSVRSSVTLKAPQPCTNEACWVTAGAASNVDRVLVASLANRTLRIKILEVATRKQVAQGQRDGVSPEPAEAAAWAEAVACKLLVPTGCTGEAVVQAPTGVELDLDGRALKPGEKRVLPVGVHTLRIKEGSEVSSRAVPVLIEGAPPVTIGPAPPPPVAVAAPAAAVSAAPAPAPERKWTRTAGYVTAGAAVAAAAVGLYFGAKSRSDLNDAEASYRANGFYQPAGLDKLSSGNSAANTANALYIASGVLILSAAAFTFVF